VARAIVNATAAKTIQVVRPAVADQLAEPVEISCDSAILTSSCLPNCAGIGSPASPGHSPSFSAPITDSNRSSVQGQLVDHEARQDAHTEQEQKPERQGLRADQSVTWSLFCEL
jgi:hypothetical protein